MLQLSINPNYSAGKLWSIKMTYSKTYYQRYFCVRNENLSENYAFINSIHGFNQKGKYPGIQVVLI